MAKKSSLKNQAGRPVSGADEAPGPTLVKVRATKLGYYGDIRRRTGDVFMAEAAIAASSSWMERVDPSTPERTTVGADELRRQHDEMLAARASGITTAGARHDEDDALSE